MFASAFPAQDITAESVWTGQSIADVIANSNFPRTLSYSSSVQASPSVQVRPPLMCSPEVVYRTVGNGVPSAAQSSAWSSVAVTPGVPLSPMAESRSLLVKAPMSLTPTVPLSPLLDSRASPTLIAREIPARYEVVAQPSAAVVQEVALRLREERQGIFMAVQELVANQLKSSSDSLTTEINNISSMVNAISTSCDERLVRLEVDRAARATTLEKIKRDIDNLQDQFGSLSMSKAVGSDFTTKDREELLSRLDDTAKDSRQVHANMKSLQEDQDKVDKALVELRNEQRSLLYKLEQQDNDLQGLQRRAANSIGELNQSVNQRLQGFFLDADTLRTLPERMSSIEGKNDELQELYRTCLDQDIVELARVVRSESQARIGLSESLDAYRSAYLQTTTELRAELDSLSETSSKKGRAGPSGEDRSKLLALERTVAEIRQQVRSEGKQSEALLSKDIQDLHSRVSSESSARLDLSHTLDAYRNAHLQTTTELRAELDMVLEKLARHESSRRISQSNARLEKVAV